MTAHLEETFSQSVSAQAPAIVSLATNIADATLEPEPHILGLKIAVSRYDVATTVAIPGKEILISFEDLTGTPIDYTDIPQDDVATIFRAVDALREQLNRPRETSGVDITVQKNIPFETHLGGQGAAAAAVLVALAGLWSPGLAREDLTRVAHRVGPDVAAAMIGGALLAQQTGHEHILTQVLVHRPLAVVLVPAAAELSSDEMLQTVRELREPHPSDEARQEFSPELLQALSQGDAQQVALLMHNDFQPALVHLLPEHHDWLIAGMSEGALAVQTIDRGPSLVCIAEDLHEAEELAERFAERMDIAAVAETGPVTGAQLVKS